MIAADRLAAVFVEVADTLVDDFDLIEFLQMLTARASDLFDVTAAGIVLTGGDGRLQLMAASDERTGVLELFQLQVAEGPCQDCFRLGAPVSHPDLRTATGRWPRFAEHAVASGYRAVHAFPMRLRNETIGALNLFSTQPGDMDTGDARLVQALADVATISLLQERLIHRGEILTEQLQGALNSRIVIEQAKGALAQLHGLTMDESFELLRGYARRRGEPLSEVARHVTTHPERVADLVTPPPSS